ncbi:MAG: DUF362 domain-containing protein [Planctomycetota bacterium]
MARSVVSLVRTSDRRHGVQTLFRLLNPFVKRAQRVVVAPDFGAATPSPGSTHNDVLYQVVMEIRQRGAGDITVAGQARRGATSDVLAKKGVYALADELGVVLVNLDEAPQEAFRHFTVDSSHWRAGFHLAKVAVESDFLVSVGGLKTDGRGAGLALSLWAMTGLLSRHGRGDADELRTAPHQSEMIAEINVACRPSLILLDGVQAIIDGGPDEGVTKRGDVMIAGTDPVAVDAVGVTLLELLGPSERRRSRPVFEQDQLRRAVELGLGARGADDIELRTDGGGESGRLAAQVERMLALGKKSV